METDIARIAGVIVGGFCMLALLALFMFAELIAKVVALRALRRMAMVLPEADRERWLNEQAEGLLRARKRR